MSFKNIVVLGGGPIGLMCAIEAAQQFPSKFKGSRVTVVEMRQGYDRMNVPILAAPIKDHLEKLNVKQQALGTGNNAPLSNIEKALQSKAQSVGVHFLSSHRATGVVGKDKLPSGRFKSMVLTVEKYDHKAAQAAKSSGVKFVNRYATTTALKADLLVVAVGGSAVEDALFKKTLGFETSALAAESYAMYGVYDKTSSPLLQKSDLIAKLGLPVPVRTESSEYLLLNLRNISAADFDRLKQSAALRKRFMAAVGTGFASSVMGHLSTADKAVGAFEVKIKRAQHALSPNFPALVVGDAAATPHPSAGTGILTGFHGFECFKELLTALKKIHRSNDEEVTDALYHFEDSYEIWLAGKSLEGTSETLRHLLEQVKSFEEYSDQAYKSTSDPSAKLGHVLNSYEAFIIKREMEDQYNRTLLLADELLAHTNRAVRWQDASGKIHTMSEKKNMSMNDLSSTIDQFLAGAKASTKLGATDSVKRLWADISETNKKLLKATQDYRPLDEALQKLEMEMAQKKAAKAMKI